MEVARMEKVKSNLTSELARLSSEAEKMNVVSAELDQLKISYQKTAKELDKMLIVSWLILN